MAHQPIVLKEKPDVRCLVNSVSISFACGEKENPQKMNKRIFFHWNFAIVLVTLTMLHVKGGLHTEPFEGGE